MAQTRMILVVFKDRYTWPSTCTHSSHHHNESTHPPIWFVCGGCQPERENSKQCVSLSSSFPFISPHFHSVSAVLEPSHTSKRGVCQAQCVCTFLLNCARCGQIGNLKSARKEGFTPRKLANDINQVFFFLQRGDC